MKKKIKIISIFNILLSVNLNITACKNENSNFISNFYVLGDSLSDIGTGTFGQNQFLIHDSTSRFKHFQLDELYYNNCWSNGRVASQLIAEKFNINFKSGWLFNLNGKKFQQIGNNYAYGGEVADSSDSNKLIVKTFDLAHQTKMLLFQHHLQNKDAIWIEMGANDIGNLMTKTDSTIIKNKINNVINEEKLTILLLIMKGAKKLVISDVPDLTLTPKIKKILHDDQEKIKVASQTCIEYQIQWKQMIMEMQKLYNNIIIPYYLSQSLPNDMTKFKNIISNGVIETSATYSQMKTKKSSYSYQPIFNSGVNKDNVNKYFYFDEFHPGIWFHQQMANDIIKLIS